MKRERIGNWQCLAPFLARESGLTVAAALALAAILSACTPKDECSPDGKQWCANNTPHECVDEEVSGANDFWTGEPETYLVDQEGIRCERYGATCYEESEMDAYCAFFDMTCPAGASSICIDELVIDCWTHDYPMVFWDCARSDQICITDSDGLNARCDEPT